MDSTSTRSPNNRACGIGKGRDQESWDRGLMINASGCAAAVSSNWFSLFCELLLGDKFKLVSCNAVQELGIHCQETGPRTGTRLVIKIWNWYVWLLSCPFCAGSLRGGDNNEEKARNQGVLENSKCRQQLSPWKLTFGSVCNSKERRKTTQHAHPELG